MYAIKAMVLLTVDHYPGKWVPFALIQRHAMAPRELVQRVCDELVDFGQIEHAVVGDVPCYGVLIPAGQSVEVVS